MEDISYKIDKDPNGTQSIIISVYELIDELNECYNSYALIFIKDLNTFTKHLNRFVCYYPTLPLHIKGWLVDMKVIELQKDCIILSIKSLLEIL
jgi:hypothetical protein